MLRRRGKSFEIVAGHITESTALERAADAARAAYGAAALRNARALRIGEAFKGMGDFAVSNDVLCKRLGIHVDEIPVAALAAKAAAVKPGQIDAEMKADADRFRLDLDAEVHRRSVRVGLGLREYLEEGRYDAFSMNFQAFDSDEEPIDTVPFLEASKAMARGVGYAGEGDALTAALVGALSRAFGKATFCEVFCPDWRGNALFLSHMGEINPEVAASKPVLREKDYPFSPALNPAFLACGVAPGPAVFVNLAPGPNDAFELIVAPVEVLAETRLNPNLEEWVRAWIRPRRGIAEFLEAYSRLGGTHHSALVLGERVEAVRTFGLFAGLPCHVL